MGKVLESLRQGEAPHGSPAPVLPLPSREPVLRSNRAPEAPEAVEPVEEDYLYVEVGAPGKKMEGSPTVLAITSAKTPAGPTAPKPVTPAAASAKSAKKSQAMSVAFERWPGKGQASRPVAPEIIAYHQPDHAVSKQYAELFQNVIEGLGKSPVLLFTGTAAKSGTTTVLLNLAFSGCIENRRLAVVEGDMCWPAFSERLGLGTVPGWHEFLSGQVALEKTLQATANPQLFALSAGSAQGASKIPFDAFRWVLGWLRDRFDLILVDSPELGDSPELKSLVSVSNGVYLVLPQNVPDSGQVREISQNIARVGGRLRGLIHTQFENL